MQQTTDTSGEHDQDWIQRRTDGQDRRVKIEMTSPRQWNTSTNLSHRICQRDGYSVHERVPPSHWCVVKKDLSKLRQQVEDGVERRQIRPTTLDPFDPCDLVYGPCVHTVANQLLKGVSYIDGGRSWALIQHPEGLECDLFVSHGWAEGIYEFIDKVVHSWPSYTKHAYCCMLSNPQTLDIGGLIASPIDSPFARALRSAAHVLVVPNSKGSIYDRCWCTYEVFLAYKWDKTLTIATPPVAGKYKVVFLMMLTYTLSICITLCVCQYQCLQHLFIETGLVTALSAYACYICVVLAIFMPESFEVAHMFVSFSGLVCSGVNVTICAKLFATKGLLVSWSFWGLVAVRLLEEGPIFYISSHFDLLSYKQMADGRAQLEAGYSGHIRDSKASVEEDKRQILKEIREADGEDMADKTIAVLLKSGMCTKSLRKAHELGANIAGVAIVKSKCICVVLGLVIDLFRFHPFYFPRLSSAHKFAYFVARLVSCTCAVIWTVRLYGNRYRMDQKAFLVAASWKTVGLPMFLFRIARFSGAFLNPNVIFAIQGAWLLGVVPICWCCAALASAFDLGSLASIPCVGVPLATCLATSNLRCACRSRGVICATSVPLVAVH